MQMLPRLTPADDEPEVNWRQVALDGSTSHDFSRQIADLYSDLAEDWAVRTSPRTGNPLYVKPTVLVVYRKDREFLLKSVIPKPGEVDGEYDMIVASQPYRSRTSTERKVRSVIAPLARALAPGGRLIGVHSHGNDPGLEIIREIWPDEDPFPSSRHEILKEAEAQLSQSDLVFEEHDDSEALFRFELHAMPSEDIEHIGTRRCWRPGTQPPTWLRWTNRASSKPSRRATIYGRRRPSSANTARSGSTTNPSSSLDKGRNAEYTSGLGRQLAPF